MKKSILFLIGIVLACLAMSAPKASAICPCFLNFKTYTSSTHVNIQFVCTNGINHQYSNPWSGISMRNCCSGDFVTVVDTGGEGSGSYVSLTLTSSTGPCGENRTINRS